ncbi:four-helix bundle copper-binding protein [Streptacidiphilus sp. EB129]|uniref:four-helix bundle copper-binding protein n=1 Tax=Streptacidiphilus sp. EB129 TaxID=3156262 RepID=UPI003511CB96
MTQTQGTMAMSMQMRQCIDACNETHSMCERTIAYALNKGGELARRDVVMALMDCADSCRMSADMMMRQSSMAAQMCRMCAEICMSCAEMCARFDDPTMRACADACRHAASMCLQMADAAV